MKISIQEKIADLERRLLVLEGKSSPRATTTTTTVNGPFPDGAEKEWTGLWKSFDALMDKFR